MKYLTLKNNVLIFFSAQISLKYKAITKLQQELDTEDFISFLNKFTQTIEQNDYVKGIIWVDFVKSELLRNTSIIYDIYKKMSIIGEQNTYEHSAIDLMRTKQFGLMHRICSIDFIEYNKKMGFDKLDERMYKLAFEEFLIREYQPAGVLIVCDEDEEVSLTNYATDHGIPNYTYVPKFQTELIYRVGLH